MSELFDTFKARAQAVSAEVHRCASRQDALDFVLDFLQAEKVADAPQSSAVWCAGSLLEGVDHQTLSHAVPGLTFQVTRESAEAAKIGVSQVEWAISATGTLVTDAAPVERRLVSTLPTIHVAILPTAGIQPDMASVLARFNTRHSGYISMITGPSRTADIERVLTIGVHGPARLIILFVDELGIN
ncbi:MAG TPA: lactate utilization protein [Bryobacteraceae bacterium]|nr:lactate utilization protein [Bryobacteraceae bacterium]